MVASSLQSCNSYSLVPLPVANRYLWGMRPRAIRRANLLLLIREKGSIAQVARDSNTSEKYLSQIVNRVVQVRGREPRGVGDALAEKLERGCGKPAGWMDQDHSDEPVKEASAYDEQVLALWDTLFDDQRTELFARLREESERAMRIVEEMKRRKLDRAVPDAIVAVHLPLPPAQAELPNVPPAAKTTRRRKARARQKP